jgi:integrase
MDLTGIETRVDSKGAERYRAVVKDHGQLVRGSWRLNPADAKGDRIRMLAAKLDGPLTRPRGQTLDTAAERFLAGIESGDILSRKRIAYAPSTARGYRYAFRDFILPELGHIDVEKLRRSQVQRWVDWLSSQQGAGTTRNVYHALAALYTYLLPRHDGMLNPVDGVMLPRAGKPRERYAEPAEMVELLAPLPYTYALPYALAFYAGLRRSEMLGLRVEDVEGQWLSVRRSLDPKGGFRLPKNGRTRQVPVLDRLRPYLSLLPSSGPVLPSEHPTRWGVRDLSTLADKCDAIWKPLGLRRIGLHEGRHSYATLLVRAGYDIALVSEWVGHGNAATTLSIYVKPQGRVEGAADRVNTYLEK